MMAATIEPGGDTTTGSGHLLALDGVRGIAILAVLVFHFYGEAGTQASPLALDRGVRHVLDLGWVGVDLFFVLSGFLITGILFDAKNSDGFFRNFYARRALRIVPAYYGFLFVLIVILPLLLGNHRDLALLRENQGWYWTYLLNIRVALRPLDDIGHFYGNGHLWSLAIEEQFYLVWPLVVFAFGRRNLMVVCAACVVAALMFRVALVGGYIPQLGNPFAPIILTPARIDTLALGGLLALAIRSPDGLRIVRQAAVPVALAAGGILLAMFLYKRELTPFDQVVQTIGFTVFAVFFCAVIARVVTAPPTTLFRRVCEHGSLRFFGRYSYALYIVHLQIVVHGAQFAVDHGLLRRVGGSAIPAGAAFTVAGIVVSTAIAWLSWHLFEQHFLKLKRYFPYRSRRTGRDPQPDVEPLSTPSAP